MIARALLLALAMTVQSLWGVISVDSTISGDQSTASPNVATPAFSTRAGNELLLAFVSSDNLASQNTTVTSISGAGLVWELVVRTNVQSGTAEIWRAFAISPLSNVSVTASLSQSVASSITVISLSGVDTSGTNGSGAIGATAGANGTSGFPTAALVSTRDSSWVFGVGNDFDKSIPRTAGPGQTLVHQFFPASGDTYWVQMLGNITAPSGTTLTISDPDPTGDQFNLSICEVLPAVPISASTWSLSGYISPAPTGSGVGVTLSGAASSSTTADPSGYFSFTGLANGNYAVTPSLPGYSFNPSTKFVTLSSADLTGINFAAIGPIVVPTTSTISGSIAPSSAAIGATVSISGAASATTTADAAGNFSFTGLPNGAYTVTPNRAGYTFTPNSRTVIVSGLNQTGISFTSQAASSNSISIDAIISGDRSSGSTTVTTPAFSTISNNELLLAFVASDAQAGANTTVSSVTGAGLTWVLVVRTNVQSGTAEIWRAFTTAALSNVSVTATLSQSVVSSITVVSLAGVDTSGTNGSGAIGAIAGTNSSSGAPSASLVTTRGNSWVFGVGNDFDQAIARTLGPGQSMLHQSLPPVSDTYWVQMQSASTAASGTLVVINDIGPSTDRFNLSICEVLAATSGGTGTPSWSISGALSPASGGNGASVMLGGAATATTVADANGNYSLAGLANGTYTVTPIRAGYSFTPASQTITVNAADVPAVNFAATVLAGQTYTISGTISPALGGSGATVILGGAASATTTASAAGTYTFSGLSNGAYTITPGNRGYTFSPPVQSVVINGSSASAINFIAGAGYMISGAISPAASAVGATVALSGTVNASTTITGSGTFTFTGLPPGSYTVTPSRANATLSPANQSVSISTGNASGIDFTATSTENVIFFDNFSQPVLSSDWTIISRHGEYAQSETECNIPQQVSTGNGLTITTAAQNWSCGDSNIDGTVRHAPSTWPYITGDIQWTNKSFTYGTVEARAKFPPQNTSLWPAIWLLGKNCQVTNIYTADVGYSTCPSLGNSGYVESDLVECYGAGWCQFHVANNSFGIGGGCDAVYTVDTNWHTFATEWTSTSIKQYMDGVLKTTCASSITDPMFLIIQTQTGGAGGTPNNANLPAQLMVDYVKVTQP